MSTVAKSVRFPGDLVWEIDLLDGITFTEKVIRLCKTALHGGTANIQLRKDFVDLLYDHLFSLPEEHWWFIKEIFPEHFKGFVRNRKKILKTKAEEDIIKIVWDIPSTHSLHLARQVNSNTYKFNDYKACFLTQMYFKNNKVNVEFYEKEDDYGWDYHLEIKGTFPIGKVPNEQSLDYNTTMKEEGV